MESTDSVSVMEKSMESYRNCLSCGASYGELQEVSASWRKLRIATESVSVTKQAMESYSKCLRFEANYGAIGSVSVLKQTMVL